MKTTTLSALALLGLTGLWIQLLEPRPAGQDAAKPTVNRYIGAEKCKSCHGAPEGGDQYSAWKKMKHAVAFETLATPAAKEAGAARGIAEPQKADACLRCHVTAFGVPEEGIKKGFERTNGVQCETCHGPGEAHMKARFAAAASGAAPGTSAIPAGEIVATPRAEVCRGCHNEQSPSYKPFCFHEFNAKIRHLDPRKPRTSIDIGPCDCPKCASGCPDECTKLSQLK